MKFRVFKKQLFGGYSKKDVNSFVIELSAENDKNFAELQRASAELNAEKRRMEELVDSNAQLNRRVTELEQKCIKQEIKDAQMSILLEQLKQELEEQKELTEALEAELEVKQAELDNKVLPINSVIKQKEENGAVILRNGTDGGVDYSDDSALEETDNIQAEIRKIKQELRKVLDNLDSYGDL